MAITDRVSYDDIAKCPDFNKIYASAIEKAKIWKKLETHSSQGTLHQPLRILDMGGGIGALGTLLMAEFGPFVDYTNIDTDKAALEKSPGKTVHGSYTKLPKLLGEQEFDYVFCLNLEERSRLNQRTIDNMKRDGQGGGFFGADLVSMTSDAAYGIKQANAYLVLLNTALVVANDGKFIRGGVIPKDALKGTIDELTKLGFQPSEDEQLTLSMKTSRLWAKYDLQFAGGILTPSQLERIAQTYAQNFRLAIFGRKKEADKKQIRGKIVEASNKLSELHSFIEAQERFWD